MEPIKVRQKQERMTTDSLFAEEMSTIFNVRGVFLDYDVILPNRRVFVDIFTSYSHCLSYPDQAIKILLNSENKPRGLYFSKALFEGLIFGVAYILRGLSTEGSLRFKIDWDSLIVRSKFTVFALFYFVFEANFPSTGPGGGGGGGGGAGGWLIFGGAI